MSRVGKNPIVIPKGVKVSINGQVVDVEGPKGKLSHQVHEVLTVKLDGETILVNRPDDLKFSRAIHGTTRAILNNLVKGVSEGYRKVLEIVGVGYRVEQKGKDLNLVLGFSHPVIFVAPDGVSLKADGQLKIVIEGNDKQKVGQAAAEIRKYRRPEPYKGKGIRYEGEIVRRKQGKKTGK
jgi:large subunit ribosomal protein L6